MADKNTEEQATSQGSDNQSTAKSGGRKPGRKKKRSGKISKMEGVRRALAELGEDAMPKEIQDYVKKNFNLVMSTDHISTYKGDIRRKAARAGKAGAAKAEKAPARKKEANGKAAVWSSEDILAARALMNQVGGADQAHALIDVLSR